MPASQNPQLRGGSSVVERRFEEPSVGGSTPFRHIFDNLRRLCYRRKACTKGKSIPEYGDVAQLGQSARHNAGGRWFKSSHVREKGIDDFVFRTLYGAMRLTIGICPFVVLASGLC